MTTIVWLRQDLRLYDNPALWHSVQQGQCVPVYIYDEDTLPLGGASKWWLHHSLMSLKRSLEQRGYQLQVFQGEPLSILDRLSLEYNAFEVAWNRCYEPSVIQRDTKIKSKLEAQGLKVSTFKGSLLFEPWEIRPKQGEFFKVFTPFWRRCQQESLGECLPKIPGAIAEVRLKECNFSVNIQDLCLLPKNPDWSGGIQNTWKPGEGAAQKRLKAFISDKVDQYKQARDYMGLDATSKLSPHLHFGEISPRDIWHRVRECPDVEGAEGMQHFLSELGWREFSYHLLFHVPHLPEKSFRPQFEGFPWIGNQTHLTAWQRGQTGIPVVDAGMRELWHTGYMHNRVRMIVASFLTKNLLIDWRKGADWFWDTLVDADLASNSSSWQWVAGSGVDAAPYFRIFNPVTQGERFDVEGQYVKKWIPELKALDSKYIHQPWIADEAVLKKAGVDLGETYPTPIVDLKATRQHALDAYASIRTT